MKGKSSAFKYVLGAVIFIGGLGVFLYPVISGFVNERSQSGIVEQYEEAIAAVDDITKAHTVEEARAYNASLLQGQKELTDPFRKLLTEDDNAVTSVLNVGAIMGYVEIPKIGVKLPIYEGTTEENLQKGVGWMSGSSLPIGGESTNCVLTGHRGLPTARLFTDIDQLGIADEFFVRNMMEILAYRVVDVQVVEPGAIETLRILESKDRITLLTCHPYMINSHRLLVIGERIPYTGQLEKQDSILSVFESLTPVERDFALAIVMVVVLTGLVILFIWRSRRKKKREEKM